jgi:hypothetical protein
MSEAQSTPPESVDFYTEPKTVCSFKLLTDSEARMAFVEPASIFKGFSRVPEIDQHPYYKQQDNWERRFRSRKGRITGSTEIDGQEFTTNIVIQEPNIAFRGLQRLLGNKKVANAFIERAVQPAPRRTGHIEN